MAIKTMVGYEEEYERKLNECLDNLDKDEELIRTIDMLSEGDYPFTIAMVFGLVIGRTCGISIDDLMADVSEDTLSKFYELMISYEKEHKNDVIVYRSE